MKRLFFLSFFLATTTVLFPVNVRSDYSNELEIIKTKQNDWSLKYSGYKTETPGSQRKISFKFSSNISNSDLGEGIFRYNNGSLKNISFLFLDDFDLSGEDQTDWYMKWKKVAGASGKARINIVEIEGKNVNAINVKGVFVRENGYWRIQAEYVSGPMPVDGEIYYFELAESQKPAEEASSEISNTTENNSEAAKIETIAEPVKAETKVEEAAAVVTAVALPRRN